jgi:hypothetical protein
MGSKNAFSTLEQRIQWLLNHCHFLVGNTDVRKVVLAMKHDKLVSKLTYWPDVKLDDAIKQAKFRWYAEHNGKELRR